MSTTTIRSNGPSRARHERRAIPGHRPDGSRLGTPTQGYHPVPVLRFDAKDKAAGKRPDLVGWETVCATADEAEIRRWSEDHGQRNCLNTGLLCGSVVGLDLDIPD